MAAADSSSVEFQSGDPEVPWVKFTSMANCIEVLKQSAKPCAVHFIDLSVTLLTPGDLDALCALLTERSDIAVTKLRLAYNALDDEAAPAVLNAVEHCSQSLEYLDLSFNHFSDTGLGFIASGCVTCQQLRAVYFSNNRISDAGVKCLVELCRHNENINACDVSGNEGVSIAASKQLLRALCGVHGEAPPTLIHIEQVATTAADDDADQSGSASSSPNARHPPPKTPLRRTIKTVSYTHLTLPTIYSV